MKHFFGRCALPMLFLAPACVTEFPGGAPSPTGASPAPEAGPPGGAPSPPATPPSPVPAASRAPAAPARLGLARAIITALERNPQLAVARKSEGVSEAALEVSRAYPYNPMLQTDLRPYSREEGGETGEFFVEAALLQEIELAGQGRYRRRTGAAELTRAQWEIRAVEVQVIAETGRRFFDALYWRERRELDESLA